jgi:hypothetical protein
MVADHTNDTYLQLAPVYDEAFLQPRSPPPSSETNKTANTEDTNDRNDRNVVACTNTHLHDPNHTTTTDSGYWSGGRADLHARLQGR